MITSKVEYLGDLRTKCTHIKSGQTFLTSAPVDNKGKGDAFSPTDLMATSFASCIITIMGIYCHERSIEFDHCSAMVTKIMESNPRRIGKLVIDIDLSGNNWEREIAEGVIRAGKACPVAKTLGDNIEVEYNIHI